MAGNELIPPPSTMQDPNALPSGRPNLQGGKLRLKRTNSDSTQTMSGSHASKTPVAMETLQIHSTKENCQSNSKDDDEDSLADFKSPKRDIVRKPILNKYKVDVEKTKRKTVKSNSISSSSSNKSRINNAKQLSIESSLSKASNQNQPDLKEAIPCPVCLKPFKDDVTCTNHMKSCAAKNNVTIKQLLEAKRLQDRQAQERKAIGLLAAPVLPTEKKKAFKSKNFSTGDDPQLQLVLAMSESLYEAEKMAKLEEAALLAGFPSDCIKEMSDEERRKTLQNFGFTTNRPIADPPASNRQRKKKLIAPTTLQTRTKQDKDRVLTERIACILTGDDALTQVNAATVSKAKSCTTSINSKLLKRLQQTQNKLWDQSRLTNQRNNFYVDALKAHLVHSAQQARVESHQVVVNDGDSTAQHACDTPVLYDPMDLDVIMNNQQVVRTGHRQQQFNVNDCDNLELELAQNTSSNWKEALNDSSASDVLIFVKNNKHIYAHKLVFHVQCPNILLDIEPMNAKAHPQIERKISWLDKEPTSALAFLEFIYSGTICKYLDIFNEKSLLQQVQQLARLYKVQDLFTYVRKKQQQLLQLDEQQGHVQGKQSDNKLHVDNGIQTTPREIAQVTLESPSPVNLNDERSDQLVAKNLAKNLMVEHSIDRQITASPDLFDSDEDETSVEKIKIEINLDLENDDGVADDDLSSQKTLVNLSRSVSPVENIHEAVTPPPPSRRSPERRVELFEENSIFNQQEIAEALTPKCRSPAAVVVIDAKQEAVDNAKDDLCNAVTPEHNSMAELNDHITRKKFVYVDVEVHDTASPPAADDVDESIYTAVTPPRLPEKPVQTVDVTAPKYKSELTMFIEKVQRINAKDIMETDSETDTPDNQARRKNPFSKRELDDSCKYLRIMGKQEHRKAISLLEKDVLNDEREKNELEEVDASKKDFHTKADEVSQTDIDITVDEAEMSTYSKYKRSTKDGEQNSIAVYRKKLNFSRPNRCIDDRSVTGIDDSIVPNSRGTCSQIANKPKPRIIEDVTLVSDSDEEMSPLRTLLKDKSKKNFYKSIPTANMDKNDTSVNAPIQRSNLENDDAFPAVGLPLKEESKDKVIDLSVDSDEDDVKGNNTFQIDALSSKQISRTKQLQTSINRQTELEMAEKRSKDIDAEITKILQSSQETIGGNIADHGQDKNDDSTHLNSSDLDTQCKVDSSPVSIVSSPELRELELDQRSSQKYKNHASKYDCPQDGENGDNELITFDDWDAITPPRGQTFKSFERLSAETGSPSDPKDDRMSLLISSPILSQNRHGSRGSLGKSLKITTGLKNKRPSPLDRNSEDVRKLKVKSASASTLTEETKKTDSLHRSSSFVTPDRNKSSSNYQKDGTPATNVSLLGTPDLQKELKKFGLKPQTRTKAKALLTHIYKETLSQKRTSSAKSTSSDEDEPPAKRQYTRNDSVHEQKEGSAAEKSSVIAEEMVFDDADVANIFQNPVSIKAALFKLIKTNREIYNKVLTYEPLPLESLHAILKQSGFKCKINSLMDVLDEQCITFRVKASKGDRTKKK